MKIALIGATGNAGSRILVELLQRGHIVTGIVRHPDKLPSHAGLVAKQGDVNDKNGLVKLISGHDAVISAVRFLLMDPNILISAVKQTTVDRLLVVGGAGSLEVQPGLQLVDTPQFPEAPKKESIAGREFLNLLYAEEKLNWTFLSPSFMFVPGDRTCTFRLGTDQLLVDENKESKISFEDFAVALIDELENPQHYRQRFTVGY